VEAVRYTAPRLEGKAQTLVDEAGTKATSQEERERMLIATAFPEAPGVGEQPPTIGRRPRPPTGE